jgi:hypothetical protein
MAGRTRLDYRPLTDYLVSQREDELHLSFAEVEQILGRALPRAAYTTAWWGASYRTSQGRAWLAAGWVVKERHVRLRVVTFARRGAESLSAGVGEERA